MSAGPLACPFTRLQCSLIRLLRTAHFAHSLACEKMNDWMAISFCVFFFILYHSAWSTRGGGGGGGGGVVAENGTRKRNKYHGAGDHKMRLLHPHSWFHFLGSLLMPFQFHPQIPTNEWTD